MTIKRPWLSYVSASVILATTLAGCLDNDHHSHHDSNMEQARKMVGQMTTEEKIRMLVGSGFSTDSNVAPNPVNYKKTLSGVAGYINGVKNDQLDIPAATLSDGPAGVRITPGEGQTAADYDATAWPIGSLLASSWDVDLVQQVGQAFGQELKDLGVDFLLAPGMNIQRNPLNGRNFEYYSEDPLLAGRMAGAMVEGVQSIGVGATIKHFVANNSETNRMNIDEIITPRALREIYLRGFHIAVEEAHPMAIMTSYNRINGTYNNARHDLLTDIVRSEWDFQGLVMSDWFAGDLANPYTQIAAGNDLIEPGGEENYQSLLSSFQNGDLSEEAVNTSATRILSQVMATPAYITASYPGVVQNKSSHLRISRQAAAESMVLLKNDNIALPIQSNQRVASFGINQVNTFKGGTGSGDVNVTDVVNIAQGLAGRLMVDSALQEYYRQYFADNQYIVPGQFGGAGYADCDEPTFDDATIRQYAEDDGIAVISIGRQAGEGDDRTATKGDYLLSDDELALIHQVSTEFHAQNKTVVVVLNINGVIDTTQWSDEVDAILLAYMPGQNGGHAVADVLSGDVNPSGKLAQTFPQSYADVPSSDTFPGVDTDSDGTVDTEYYNDDIYVGYRYYTTFNRPVAYPFGYGLSYTTFSYDDPAITDNTLSDGADGSLKLSVNIRNVGGITGREVAEVYIAAPQDDLPKPAVELKAFAKTDSLTPGGVQTLDFTVPAYILASFDPQANQWAIDPGEYRVYITPSSVIGSATPLTFSVSQRIVVETTTAGAMALPAGVDPASFVTVSQ